MCNRVEKPDTIKCPKCGTDSGMNDKIKASLYSTSNRL